jgi:hypothetical protein
MLAWFGVAWAVLATRSGGVMHHSRQSAWIGVIALGVMPGLTAWTVWPFRLRFLTARSALERVADQIAAGQAVSFPQSAGPFRLAASTGVPGTHTSNICSSSRPQASAICYRRLGSRTLMSETFTTDIQSGTGRSSFPFPKRSKLASWGS